MGEFSLWHWIVVAIVFMALFGYRKLPDAARSIGRSMRVFKAEMKGMRDDDERHDPTRPAQQGPVVEGQVLPPPQPERQSPGAAAERAAGTPPPATAARPTGAESEPPRGE
jgi:sec-independent protein translocase protein TatA